MTDQIEAQIRQLMIDHFLFEESAVVNTARLTEDLDMDSLDAMDLLMTLNEELNINIPPEKLEDLKTLQNLIDLVKEYASQ